MQCQMIQNCPRCMLDAELNGSDQVRGASIIDVDSIGEGGGQPKVDHSIKLQVINGLIIGGGGSKSHKN